MEPNCTIVQAWLRRASSRQVQASETDTSLSCLWCRPHLIGCFRWQLETLQGSVHHQTCFVTRWLLVSLDEQTLAFRNWSKEHLLGSRQRLLHLSRGLWSSTHERTALGPLACLAQSHGVELLLLFHQSWQNYDWHQAQTIGPYLDQN